MLLVLQNMGICGGAHPESSSLFPGHPLGFSSDPSAVPLSDSSSMVMRVSTEEHSELTLLCSVHSAQAKGDGNMPSKWGCPEWLLQKGKATCSE